MYILSQFADCIVDTKSHKIYCYNSTIFAKGKNSESNLGYYDSPVGAINIVRSIWEAMKREDKMFEMPMSKFTERLNERCGYSND